MGFLAAAVFFLAACSNDMADQPRYDPLEPNEFFPDRRSARPLPEEAVPFSQVVEDPFFYTGRSEDGELVDAFPFEVTAEVLERGRERYDIYCSPCHGLDGYGQGMIVQRGFSPPPSFHIDRLREAPAGYFFEVITNGFGQMYSYDYPVEPADRWAITAYIRALQLSQNAQAEDLPPEAIQQLGGAQP
ncbi:MAG: cytochrome c [Chloroflexota bacterium]|nr:MAG: cytochrome c [Chloroflexota bacterium]